MSDPRWPASDPGDDALGTELRELGAWLDFGPVVMTSAAAPDPAWLACRRILEARARARRGWWPFGRSVRPLRRGLVLAVVLLALLAAIVGAIGFGVPGIRIFFSGAAPTPAPTVSAAPVVSPTASTLPGPLGADLDLGFLTTAAEAPTLTDFGLLRPTDPSVGPPDTIWSREGRLNLVWKSRPGLPDTAAPGIGLLLTEFRGSVNRDFFGKMIGGGTTITPVTVDGSTGYWIAGTLHDFFYLDANGQVMIDGRRVVGDTLIWTRGAITFRLETSLGREAAIRIAATVR
ncbi:MAG: hypothetical protein QOF49_1118 [Chloroflexota bacterium]|nr:hypothetical protein [Chloroflexota bacterium]